MKLLCWWVTAASLMAALAVGQGVAQEPDLASVKAAVCDTFGQPVPGAKVTLTSVGPNETFTAVGGEARFDRIPFGLYDLEVRLPGFLTRKERIRVYQPSLIFQISLELAPTHSYERPELSGSIRSDVKARPDLWVRLTAIYSSDLVENAVDGSGKFELDGIAPGKYLLILFQKDKVLATKPIDVLGGKQTVELALESK